MSGKKDTIAGGMFPELPLPKVLTVMPVVLLPVFAALPKKLPPPAAPVWTVANPPL